MAAPVLQFKRGNLASLPGLQAGEPGFTVDKYDLYVGIDSTTNIREFKNSIGNKFALQGNLDVDILKSDKKTIYNSVNNILKEYNNPSGHIFNLGTGITPDIHPDKVKYLIDVLADVSPQYNVK